VEKLHHNKIQRARVNNMSTSHLSHERAMDLFVYCTNRKTQYFSTGAVTQRMQLNGGNVSRAKTDRSKFHAETTTARGIRLFMDEFFATKPLPAEFTATTPATPVTTPSQPPVATHPPPVATPPPSVATPPPPVATPPPNSSSEAEETMISVMTWNCKNLGTKTSAVRKARIASSIAWHDVVALQELRSEQVYRELIEASGSMLNNHLVLMVPPPKTTHAVIHKRTEYFAFCYNTQAVELVDSELRVHAIDGVRYAPCSATFALRGSSEKGSRLTLVNVHVVHGGNSDEAETLRAKEIQLIGKHLLVDLLNNRRKYGDVCVCGDFNLPPEHPAFEAWRSTIDSKNLSLRECNIAHRTNVGLVPRNYDNFWIRNSADVLAVPRTLRVLEFTEILQMNDKRSRARFRLRVSDHLPVVMEFAMH
jgi:endonuclease/exonuclease/phosphatase family metal-dependent hydrolase